MMLHPPQSAGRLVAVKVIPVQCDGPDHGERHRYELMSEVNALRRCTRANHQNVVQYLGVADAGKNLHIFMELVGGGNLRELIKHILVSHSACRLVPNSPNRRWAEGGCRCRGCRPTLARSCADWALPSEVHSAAGCHRVRASNVHGEDEEPLPAEGTSEARLDHIHSCRPHILHRDIKPANLLIRDSSQINKTLKIADFGIATSPAKAGGSADVVGTPPYKQ
eukprot:gene57323-biopygen69753